MPSFCMRKQEKVLLEYVVMFQCIIPDIVKCYSKHYFRSVDLYSYKHFIDVSLATYHMLQCINRPMFVDSLTGKKVGLKFHCLRIEVQHNKKAAYTPKKGPGVIANPRTTNLKLKKIADKY